MDHKQNYIAGEWLAGVSEVENRNPSDTSDLIGMFAQADAVQLDRALDAAGSTQKQWANAGLERRYNVFHAIGTELMRAQRNLASCCPGKKASRWLKVKAKSTGQGSSSSITRPNLFVRSEIQPTQCATASRLMCAASQWASWPSFRHGISPPQRRARRSRRHWRSAMPWSGNRPISLRLLQWP